MSTHLSNIWRYLRAAIGLFPVFGCVLALVAALIVYIPYATFSESIVAIATVALAYLFVLALYFCMQQLRHGKRSLSSKIDQDLSFAGSMHALLLSQHIEPVTSRTQLFVMLSCSVILTTVADL